MHECPNVDRYTYHHFSFSNTSATSAGAAACFEFIIINKPCSKKAVPYIAVTKERMSFQQELSLTDVSHKKTTYLARQSKTPSTVTLRALSNRLRTKMQSHPQYKGRKLSLSSHSDPLQKPHELRGKLSWAQRMLRGSNLRP